MIQLTELTGGCIIMATKKYAKAKTGGQPSKYNPKFHPQLTRWMKRCGLSYPQIAQGLEVHETTMWKWAKKYPEMASALKESGNLVDSMVEDSLLKRALGYEIEEIKESETQRADGKTTKKIERQVKVVVPDTTAQIFWLKNRQPARWRDRVEVETSEEKEIRVVLGMEGLTDEN